MQVFGNGRDGAWRSAQGILVGSDLNPTRFHAVSSDIAGLLTGRHGLRDLPGRTGGEGAGTQQGAFHETTPRKPVFQCTPETHGMNLHSKITCDLHRFYKVLHHLSI